MIHQAYVHHHIPGRMRVRLPYAKGNAELLQQVQRSISPLRGVKHVEVNPVTSSVLIHYDEDQHEDFHSFLTKHAEDGDLFTLEPLELTEAEEITKKIEAEAEFLAAHSETARAIVNFVKRIDTEIKRATGNNLDLKVLVPLGLAVWAFVKAEAEVATPLWVTLGIFSFNSFVSLHHPPPTHPQTNLGDAISPSVSVQATPAQRRTLKVAAISKPGPSRKRG